MRHTKNTSKTRKNKLIKQHKTKTKTTLKTKKRKFKKLESINIIYEVGYVKLSDLLARRVSVVWMGGPRGNFGNIKGRGLRLLLGVQGEVTKSCSNGQPTNGHSQGAVW